MSSSRRSFLAGSLALPAAASLRVSAAAPKQPALAYRTLGRTGLKVTTLGFGCMITSDPSVIQRAVDLGVNYFDTAREYQSGNNERMVGAALKGRRDKVYIATKTEGDSKQSALAQLETSLKALQTDHVDIWHLHGKDSPGDITDDLREAQRIAKKAGKIRFAGVSTHSPNAVRAEILKDGHFDVVLAVYNFMVGTADDAFLEAMQKAGIGVVAMKVMAGGHKDPKSGPIMKRQGAAVAALKWILKNPAVATTIPSMTDHDQLDENMLAMAGAFSGADGKVLAARADEIRNVYCRMCGSCSGQCAQGLPVREVLRSVMYAEGYGQFSLGRDHFRKLPAEAQAVRCGDCAGCTVKCPNGVAVAQRATLAQNWFA
jgi:aryl-alcohol dehydrogenase-like predicted oxidoreductase